MIADLSDRPAANEAESTRFSAQVVQAYLRSSYNPMSGLTPEQLVSALDSFQRGYLRPLALIMEAIERRDDTIAAVAPKRKKAPARHGWEILGTEETPEAEKHKAALQFFYDNLTATSALEQDEVGGMSLLTRQMMDAVGFRYSVHEIVWEPVGQDITATFWQVPLSFFESTTGKLRFKQNINTLYGVDMAPNEWLVCVGDGLMIPCAVAYMYKSLPLKDWLVYSGRHGMPGIEGVTDAPFGGDEWNQMVSVVEAAGREMAWVRSSNQAINKVDFGASGELPYPKLVERMDKAMARLWRGADASTLSAKQGEAGASVQEDESEILETDDAQWLSECLEKVSRLVIEWKFGQGVRPLAYIQIQQKPTPADTQGDLAVDAFLLKSGVDLSVNYARQKYGRPAPQPDEELMRAAPAPQIPQLAPPPRGTALHSANAREYLAAALQSALNAK